MGKTRHIEVQYLWVQEEVAEGRLDLRKLSTHSNPADALTKVLSKDKADMYMKDMGMEYVHSRSDTALRLQK